MDEHEKDGRKVGVPNAGARSFAPGAGALPLKAERRRVGAQGLEPQAFGRQQSEPDRSNRSAL